jgi:glycosyltransferase involved in cell wall biosynthesis
MPEEGAGCRFRISQFIPLLKAHGIEVTLSPLFTTEFFRLVYKPGRYLQKAAAFAGFSIRRFDSLRDISRFDVVLIYREIFPIGPAVVERLLAMRKRPPIVFDFDDAIFLPSVSEANRLIAALKFPGKVSSIIRHSDRIIAGNQYLASFARRFNDAVTLIPTCVDTTKFVPRTDLASDDGRRPTGLVIGWIGSPTTAPYIRGLADALRRVAAQRTFRLKLSGAGEPIDIPGVTVDNPSWALEREVELFNTCDIGVYPLDDDEWSKGKCGFKAIEFMACGVPVVASAVGVNREIIQDGVNGFLASSTEEWVEKLIRLIDDPLLRARFAKAGRQTIEARYSLHAYVPKLAAVLRDAASGRPRAADRRTA